MDSLRDCFFARPKWAFNKPLRVKTFVENCLNGVPIQIDLHSLLSGFFALCNPYLRLRNAQQVASDKATKCRIGLALRCRSLDSSHNAPI